MKRATYILVLTILLFSFSSCGIDKTASSESNQLTADSASKESSTSDRPKTDLSKNDVLQESNTERIPESSNQETESGEHIKESKNLFDGIDFALFKIVNESGKNLYYTQNNNPEITFDTDTQTLQMARFYITYYADCDKESARNTLEQYTDELIDAIYGNYPDLNIELLHFCWKIPAIDEESLYAASYWCDIDGDRVKRGEGKGLIYE